jgi:hypothetical protein
MPYSTHRMPQDRGSGAEKGEGGGRLKGKGSKGLKWTPLSSLDFHRGETDLRGAAPVS